MIMLTMESGREKCLTKLFRPWAPAPQSMNVDGCFIHEKPAPSEITNGPNCFTFIRPFVPQTIVNNVHHPSNHVHYQQHNVMDDHRHIKAGKKQRPKRFRCPHCNVAFSNNGQLRGHVRIHTGERPFKCDYSECGKTFTRNEELTRHKRIHSGLRPYACQMCGKQFGRKDHLKKHLKTHQQKVMLTPMMAAPLPPLQPLPMPLPLSLPPCNIAAHIPYFDQHLHNNCFFYHKLS